MNKFLMPMNLQLFATDEAGGGSEGGSEGGSWVDTYLNSTNTENQKDEPKETMIPKKRFDDVNNRLKALDTDYKNRQAEYDELVKQMEEGETSKKQLEETIEAGNKRVEALEGVLKTMLDAELEQIDEEYRELVPADKPIEEQLEWLAKAKAKGLFGSRGMEFEIGQMTNPQRGSRKATTENMNPLQLLTMGYSK